MRPYYALLLAVSAVALSACSVNIAAHDDRSPPPPVASVQPGPDSDPRLLATLYMQQAEEFRRLAQQSYALAAARLPAALKGPGSSALEQTDGGKGKPPAAIFDVDETVLDNSPHQARAILAGSRGFDTVLWDKWISERAAIATPGAVEFVKELRRNQVRVVFITNRECHPRATNPGDPCPQHGDTLANLNAAGLGPVAPQDLMLKDQNGWPGDKAVRRLEVIRTHRIIMSLGDQFSDMMSVTRNDDSTARQRLAAEHEDLWNSRWIIIPNPSYGGWADVLAKPNSSVLRTR